MAGDIVESRSDSASLRFAVTMIMGGVKVRSSDVGFSSCFSSLEERTTQLGMGFQVRWIWEVKRETDTLDCQSVVLRVSQPVVVMDSRWVSLNEMSCYGMPNTFLFSSG